MDDGPVLEARDLEDAALDRVVGAEVAQVDQRRAAHVRPAAPPHTLPPGLSQDSPEDVLLLVSMTSFYS